MGRPRRWVLRGVGGAGVLGRWDAGGDGMLGSGVARGCDGSMEVLGEWEYLCVVLGDISISYRDILQISNIVSKFLNIAIWISIFL